MKAFILSVYFGFHCTALKLKMMITAYQYRLRPTAIQIQQMESWLELLRKQYNHRLAERFDWYEMNRCAVNACPLVCSIAELKDKPDKYNQKRDLVNSKVLFPEYKDIYSQVLQDCVLRVEKTFDRYFKGDSNGRKSGKPRFKGKGRYHSFTYPQMKQDCIQGKHINLPKLGWVKFIQHRPILDGFKIKTATVSRKSDGWYVTLSLQDETIPTVNPNCCLDKAVGIDLGLKDFLVTSDGQFVAIPQYYRKSQTRLKVLSQAVSRTQKGSNNRKKAVQRLGRHHQRVANQRKDFHYKTANELLKRYDIVGHEDLNIKGLAKTRLAKSIYDAGWSQFISILKVKAERAGLITIAVNPNGTSQNCSNCGSKVLKTLVVRIHKCSCGLEICRDLNAAINVKNLAVGHSVNNACGVLSDSWTEKQEAYSTAV